MQETFSRLVNCVPETITSGAKDLAREATTHPAVWLTLLLCFFRLDTEIHIVTAYHPAKRQVILSLRYDLGYKCHIGFGCFETEANLP